jgi:hypothetical protein
VYFMRRQPVRFPACSILEVLSRDSKEMRVVVVLAGLVAVVLCATQSGSSLPLQSHVRRRCFQSAPILLTVEELTQTCLNVCVLFQDWRTVDDEAEAEALEMAVKTHLSHNNGHARTRSGGQVEEVEGSTTAMTSSSPLSSMTSTIASTLGMASNAESQVTTGPPNQVGCKGEKNKLKTQHQAKCVHSSYDHTIALRTCLMKFVHACRKDGLSGQEVWPMKPRTRLLVTSFPR